MLLTVYDQQADKIWLIQCYEILWIHSCDNVYVQVVTVNWKYLIRLSHYANALSLKEENLLKDMSLIQAY